MEAFWTGVALSGVVVSLVWIAITNGWAEDGRRLSYLKEQYRLSNESACRYARSGNHQDMVDLCRNMDFSYRSMPGS